MFKSQRVFNKKIQIFIYIVYFTFAFFGLREISNKTAYQPNEYDYVARGAYLDLFSQYNNKNYLWELYDSYVQEKLPSYIYQISLKVQNVRPILEIDNLSIAPSWWYGTGSCRPPNYSDINCQTITSGNWTWSIDGVTPKKVSQEINAGLLPSQAPTDLVSINAARNVSLIFSLGSLILICLIVNYFWGFISSLIASSILIFSPLFETSTLRALGDTFLLFFLLLSFFLTVIWYNRTKNLRISKAVMLSIPIGVSFGLAMASKLNGFVSLIFFFILSVILFYKIPKIRLNLFLSFITVSAVMLSVFVILNPFVWKNPIEGTAFMVQHRWNETLYYQVQPGFKPILTFGERLYFLLARTILPGGDYVIRNHGTPLGLILFLFGGWGLYSDLKSKKNKLKIFAKLILIYGLMMWIVMGIYLKLDWDRYYLPFVPFVVIVSSRGIVKIVEFFRWFKNKYLQRVFLE